jgi:hypothetical protein
MANRRATAMVVTVVALAIVQIVYEDVLVFLGATGGRTFADSPFVLVGVPLLIFLLLASILFGWAILTDEELG